MNCLILFPYHDTFTELYDQFDIFLNAFYNLVTEQGPTAKGGHFRCNKRELI